MKRVSISFFLRFIFIVTLLSGIGWTQQSKQMVIKEIQTNIQNPLGIVSVEKPEDDLSAFQYIIRTNDQLLFCDNNYQTLKVRDVKPNDKTQMILSKKCRYVLTEEIISLPEKELGSGEKIYTLFDYKGNQYWSKKVKIYWDEIENSEMIISDFNGWLFLLNKKDACLHIIEKNGSERIVKLFENIDILPMREGYIDISKDGRNIVILINKNYAENERTITKIPLRGPNKGKEDTRHISKRDGEPIIFHFNEMGELQSKKVEDKESAANIVISDDGNYIVCTLRNFDKTIEEDGYWITKVYSNIFSLKGTLSLCPIDILFIDGELITGYRQFGTNNYLLSAFDIESLTKRWTTELSIMPITISNISVNNDNLVKIVSQTAPMRGNPYSDLQIQFVNYNGVIVNTLQSSEINTSITSNIKSKKLLLNSNEFFTNNILIKIVKSE